MLMKSLANTIIRSWGYYQLLVIIFFLACTIVKPTAKQDEGLQLDEFADLIEQNIEMLLEIPDFESLIYLTDSNSIELYSGPMHARTSLINKILVEKGSAKKKYKKVSDQVFDKQEDVIGYVLNNIDDKTIFNLHKGASFKLVKYKVK